MKSTNISIKNPIFIIALVLVIFVIAFFVFKKLFKFLNTESPVLDETSKKILNNKQLTENYYQAIEKEKKGESSRIIVEGEEYEIIRAGKHTESVAVN